MTQILITGGSGLIGRRLTSLLLREGFEVAWLSRNNEKVANVKIYRWDLNRHFVEKEALEKTEHIIHLSGANVATYWTNAYKKKIFSSRIELARLIFEKLSLTPNQVKSFISASGVGYYGDGGEAWLTEDSPAGKDFLAEVCVKWEDAAKQFLQLNKRVVILRTGIVLAKEGGTLPALTTPMKLGVAPIFGNGKQFYPWIHIDDLCRMYLQTIRNETMSSAYNACAPEPVRYKELVNEIGLARHKPKINFPVPKFLLQLMLDGFGKTLISSLRCSPKRIEEAEFLFEHSDLRKTLDNLIRK